MADKKLWGIHTYDEDLFLKKDKIAIGWHEMGNLSNIANNREDFKAEYAKTYPNDKKCRFRLVLVCCTVFAMRWKSATMLYSLPKKTV